MRLLLRLLLTTATIALIAGLAVSATSGAAPAIKMDGDTKEATSADGAPATFHVKAFDPASGNPISVTCSPSGSGTGEFSVTASFPLGTTTVSCDGVDDAGNPVHGEATVTVQDTTPPALADPPDPAPVAASSPAGAAVSWPAVTGTDIVDGPVTAACDPPSGTVFTPGSHVVTCTATDAHGNSATVQLTATVTFTDTQAPAFTPNPPPPIGATTSGTAAVVTYTVAATDDSGAAPTVTCTPPSGSSFPVGQTTVNCTASDGTNSATASFVVTVTFVDTAGPTFSDVPSNRVVEANGPSGSIVTYTAPTATDAAEGPKPVNCNPPSGSTFPGGVTTVTCSASDSHGNTGTASFTISVADTTPPALYVPLNHSIVATSPDGVSSSDPAVVAFVQSARAVDVVDPHPLIIPSLASILPLGPNTVTFEARDASGNSAVKTATLTVLPVGSTAPPPAPPPRPPVEVTNVKVTPLDGAVRIEWSAGGREVVVVRSTSDTRSLSAAGDEQVVYQGRASRYVDRGLLNGVEYRYLVMALDAAGNRSAGVAAVAVPRQDLLRSPKDGARLRKAPKLTWKLAAEAQYYNAQLFLAGEKILSVWPVRPSYKLKKSWKYAGRKYSLKPGLYTWFVWPGYGARSRVDYGPMMGTRTFRIVR